MARSDHALIKFPSVVESRSPLFYRLGSETLYQWCDIVSDEAVDNFMGAGVPEDRGRVRGGHADGVHARGTGGLDAEGRVFEDGRA